MAADSVLERGRANVTGLVSILVTGIWLAGLATGQDWWLPALLVGYVVVVPLAAVLAGEDDPARADDQVPASDDGDAAKTPLDRLRDRYARGELTDEQFERKLERLLETETLEDAEDRHRERERS